MIEVEVVSSGSELVDGSISDCNAAYIAQQLSERGFVVVAHYCIGDDIHRLIETFQRISTQSDMAVVTGGLGPTNDDLTAKAAAGAAGVNLELNQSALRSIKQFCSKNNGLFSPSDQKQAWLPMGAQCLANPIGKAPGFMIRMGRCQFFFLPGVFAEMRRMLSDQVLPVIQKRNGESRRCRHTRTVVSFGLPESAVGEKLSEMGRVFPEVKFGFRIVFPEIYIKLSATGATVDSVTASVDHAAEWISDCLGDHLVSAEGHSVHEKVGGLLRERNATVAVAESCTGGLIASLLTDVSGSSDYFLSATVTYSNESKVEILGVPEKTIASLGAVHEETAAKMAEGVRAVSGADYGLATTGIAGPTGGTADKPVGTVCIAIASADRTCARRYAFSCNDRAMNKHIFAVSALDMLRRSLLGIEV